MSKEILLLGEFSSGKSAFINMFLGLAFLPEKLNATNLPIIRISAKKPAGIWLIEKHEKNPMPLDNLSDIPNNWENIEYAELTLPFHDKLLKDLVIWDTPGINSTNKQHIKHLENFLSIRENQFTKIYYFVKGSVEKSQLDFLHKWMKFHPHMEIILNIRDYSSEETINKLFESLCKIINKEFGDIPVKKLDIRELYDDFYEEAQKRRADINDWALIKNQEKIKVDITTLYKNSNKHVEGLGIFNDIDLICNRVELNFAKMESVELEIYVNRCIPMAFYEYGYRLLNKGKYNRAIKYIQQAADLGVSDAQFLIFRIYNIQSQMLKPILVDSKQLIFSQRYLRLSLKNNNIFAKIYCLENGLILDKDIKEAFNLLLTLSNSNNPKAQFYLFKKYLLGTNKEICADFKKAWELSMLIDRNTCEFKAADLIKKIIDNNIVIPETIDLGRYDFLTLLYTFEVFMLFNSSQIIIKIGYILLSLGLSNVIYRILDEYDDDDYYSFDSVEDLKGLLKKYKNTYSKDDLYINYIKSKIVCINRRKINSLLNNKTNNISFSGVYSTYHLNVFTIASNNKIIGAILYLADLYIEGDLIGKNIVQGLTILRNYLSFDIDNKIKSKLALTLISLDNEHQIKEGFTYLNELAKSGDVKSQYLLGYFYYKGEETEHNIYLAKYWIEEAVNNGYRDSEEILDKLRKLRAFFDSKIEIKDKEYAMFYMYDNNCYKFSANGKLYNNNVAIVNDDNPIVFVSQIRKYYQIHKALTIEKEVWHPATFFSTCEYIWYKYDSEHYNCYKNGELINTEWICSNGIESVIYDKFNKINIILQNFDNCSNNQFYNCITEKFLWSKENNSYWLTLNGQHIANKTENVFKGDDLIVHYKHGNRILIFENYKNISNVNNVEARIIGLSEDYDSVIKENDFYCGLKFSMNGVYMSINGEILSNDSWNFVRNGSHVLAYLKSDKRYFIIEEENIKNNIWCKASYFADGEYLFHSSKDSYFVLHCGLFCTQATEYKYWSEELIILFDKERNSNIFISNPRNNVYLECTVYNVLWSKENNSFWTTINGTHIANECESMFLDDDLILRHKNMNVTIRLSGYSNYKKAQNQPGIIIGLYSKFNEIKPFSRKFDDFINSIF